jgi:6,7-dimethyl-8-ribityllumazine synthase
MKPILIVSAPYYTHINTMLVAGARAAIEAAGFRAAMIEVPGALEIPTAVAMAIASERYAGFVATGCVLRGETSHYEIVSNESARGLQQLGITRQAAIGNAILTCENEAQALLRADPAQGNKGGEAANACIRLLHIRDQLGLK